MSQLVMDVSDESSGKGEGEARVIIARSFIETDEKMNAKCLAPTIWGDESDSSPLCR